MHTSPLPSPTSITEPSGLHTLLDEALTFAPEYQTGLSSHLPMALQALHALGASDERLAAFHAHYQTRLRKAAASPAARVDSTMPTLGQADHFALWRQTFEQRLGDQDVDSVLREALPMLMEGAAGAAFHGLIRTAHAVRAGHRRELAAGLAYWAAKHRPTAASPAALPAASLGADRWLAGLTALARQHRAQMPERPGISQSIADWAATPEFAQVAGALAVPELPAVARIAAQLYAHTRNFVVLHLVTASEATNRLAPWLTPHATQPVVPALAAGLLASRVLEDERLPNWLSPLAPVAAPGWDALAAAAIDQHDDHVIKLVEACLALDQRDPHPVWQHAAASSICQAA